MKGWIAMSEHPLLVFPKPAPAEKAKRNPAVSRLRIPDTKKQFRRLIPQFKRLQEAMDKHRLSLRGNPLGLQPEQAMVIETVGPVANFLNAVEKIQGFEWLGELEIEDILPGYGFEDAKDSGKTLKGRLFLVMTEQRALKELRNLFVGWKKDPKKSFPRGLAPLKQAFTHLYTIRPRDAEDRIRDTGLLEDWKFREQYGQSAVPFEAELWFRQSANIRRLAASYIRAVVENLGGEIVQQCVLPEIAYHGVLGRIPLSHASEIIRQSDVRLLSCEDIMQLRPVGQCAVLMRDDLSDADEFDNHVQLSPPQGEPIVALFDGLPLTGHRLLDGRLSIDDPDGFETAYQARERVHGTAMSSLICHGDLNENEEPLERPLYVRPILQPRRGFEGQFYEAMPDTVLPVDLVHLAVRRLFEGEGDEPPAAPNVRVINLSVCDKSRPFDRGMSSWARLLDWLSWKYRVLFVVSAGNHLQEIELDLPRNTLGTMSPQDRQKAVIRAVSADTRHRRLLSPAETLNGLTIAATHADMSNPVHNPNWIDPFAQDGLPSTVSAHGPGYRRIVKPEIFLPGGRQLLRVKLGTTHANEILQTVFYSSPPGQRVASPGPAGELDRTVHTRGTSNAAALASRCTNHLFDVIERLRLLPGIDLPREFDVVLLKTLLVHGANWDDAYSIFESILKNSQNGRIFKDYVGRFLGYGATDVEKVMACTNQRVTVLGVGRLDDGEAHEFAFPLPPSLSAITEKRRLTITLSWLTPVTSTRQEYRIAHLWFNPKNELAPNRICTDYRAAQRGTVQHEVLEGYKAVDFQDGNSMAIKVNCRADAGDIPEPIRYGLAVTLEVAEAVGLPIYQEVRNRLRVRVPVRSGGEG